ncbi:MAG TPA: hypothetical protein PKC18_13130 [Lacipirellulaceae bacterium]|nr:hypothetical protein [Lacipirellulaceae bacterium]
MALATTAVFKLTGLFFRLERLSGHEPVTGLPLPLVTAMAAGVELLITAVLLWGRNPRAGAWLVLLFAAGVLIYRTWFLPAGSTCSCLGGWLDGATWMPIAEPALLLAVALWLALTAFGVLLRTHTHDDHGMSPA